MYFIYHSSLQHVCPTHALSSEAFCLELVTLLNMLLLEKQLPEECSYSMLLYALC